MERVTGIGGIFFKAKNPRELQAWYAKHLGVPVNEHGIVLFHWSERDEWGAERHDGMTVWSAFAADTKYFAPSDAPLMINYRVQNLDAMVAQLTEAGVALVGGPETSEYGSFAWVMDPEGNKVELWQPPEGQ